MKNKKIFMVLLLFISLSIFLYYENNFISITKINVTSNKLPNSFHGFKIVHLSDLHNKSFGKKGIKLVKKVQTLDAEAIVFTGDLIDHRNYNEANTVTLMKEMVKIAPVYYVTGNHEWIGVKFTSLEEKLKEVGVVVLRNQSESIDKNGKEIFILGIDDPMKEPINNSINTSIKKLNNDSFKILLSHRPEYVSVYNQYKIDVVFSGHAHGGQIRLPFIGGLLAPGQGTFPKYTSGKYELDNTTMIVSRGLGNSIFPQRIFNRPQIIEVTLTLN